MSQQADLEDRIAALEQLVERVKAKARQSAYGRAILAMLGLS